MPVAYTVSICHHYDPRHVERERWRVLTMDDQEAIYRVWRATPTSHFDEIKIVGTLTESEIQRLGLKINEPVKAPIR